MPSPRLLADDLASSLSNNAREHLRAARVARHPEMSASPEALRGMLMERGLPVFEPLIELESRSGGAAFPGGHLLSAACFLRSCPSLTARDLPAAPGGVAVPVYGLPEHLAEWESPFGVLSPSGAILMYDAPRGPSPAFSSLEHFLEVLALAPLSERLHSLRVDAFCGETLAGLLNAYSHPPAAGEHTSGWIGDEIWVKEMRIALPDEHAWSSYRGTFVCAERTEVLVELITLLLEQGFSLGHRGPRSAPPSGAVSVASFVDHAPELGFRANVRVSVWETQGGYTFSHLVERAC